MKVRFYTIQDLYDEVKDLGHKPQPYVVRMQFLSRTYSQEFRGGGHTSSLPMVEQILTLTVAKGEDVLYYSEPFLRYITYEAEQKKERVEEKAKELEDRVREVFKYWTIKKGVYEPST